MGRTAGIWPYVCLVPALAAINWVGLQNYHDLLTGGQTFLIRALQVTAIFSLLVTVVQNGVAVLIAWLLNARLRGQIAVRSLVFMPVVLGATVNGLTWYVMFNPLGGPVTLVLGELGIRANLLGNAATALYAVIWVQIWANLGFSMMVYLAGMQGSQPKCTKLARSTAHRRGVSSLTSP